MSSFKFLGKVESRAAASPFFKQGLTDDLLRAAVEAGDAARNGCRATDPDDYPARTAHTVAYRYLCDHLRSRGWHSAKVRGQVRLVTPDGRHALVFASGDEITGLRLGSQPRTRSAKGEVTTNAIRLNLNLFLFGWDDAGPDDAEIWFVLVAWIDGEKPEVRFELSRPVAQQSSGVIHVWDARVMFDPILGVPDPYDSGEEPEEEVDFRIRRK